MKVLKFKWTVSRSRDTYGYNICSLYVDQQKVGSSCGGGYDMKGSAFGRYLTDNYQTELLGLAGQEKDLYGLIIRNGKAYVCIYSKKMVKNRFCVLTHFVNTLNIRLQN